MEELKTLGTFGLKTKRELWKAHTELSRVRHQARSLLALGQEIRQEKEPILMKSLLRIGIVGKDSSLDDVLNLQVTDLLARRLQTVVMKKFDFKTPYQARQAVVHGHIIINDRIVNIPSYTVTVEEEEGIMLRPGSSLTEILERVRQAKEDAARTVKAEEVVDDGAEGAVEGATSAAEDVAAGPAADGGEEGAADAKVAGTDAAKEGAAPQAEETAGAR